MSKLMCVSIILMLISAFAFAQVERVEEDSDYQRYVEEIEKKWMEADQKQFEGFQQLRDMALQEFQDQDEAAYRQYVEEIERKWNEFIGPTRSQWVDYSEDKDTRVIVNFEEKEKMPEDTPESEKPENGKEPAQPEDDKGIIRVETLIPAGLPNVLDTAKEKLSEQIEKIFSAVNDAKTNFLEGQVRNQAGEAITPENVKPFIQAEVLPEARVQPQPIKSQDGVERVKVSIGIPMVPAHLRIRAEKYRKSVERYSRQYDVETPLVLAVIETESYFNPLARSPIPAFGLMQLVPKYGGREAYRYVFKKDKIPSSKYLYVPENNIRLGTAYLHVLKADYLYGIKDPHKQEFLVVAAYNGGIGRVIKRVLKRYNVPKMPVSKVYETLRREMPDETKDYLEKVTARKDKYLAWK